MSDVPILCSKNNNDKIKKRVSDGFVNLLQGNKEMMSISRNMLLHLITL